MVFSLKTIHGIASIYKVEEITDKLDASINSRAMDNCILCLHNYSEVLSRDLNYLEQKIYPIMKRLYKLRKGLIVRYEENEIIMRINRLIKTDIERMKESALNQKEWLVKIQQQSFFPVYLQDNVVLFKKKFQGIVTHADTLLNVHAFLDDQLRIQRNIHTSK